MTLALAGFTARALLGRRRAWLVLLLAAIPVVVGLLATLSGTSPGPHGYFANLIVRTVLPLIALLLGTAALGAAIDDGTVVYLLVKPIPRRLVALVALLVAGGITAVLGGLATILSGLFIGAPSDQIGAFVAAVIGASFAYTAVFLALSLVTSHALIIGLVYTLVWEGLLASLFEGTRILSIREYTLAVADGLVGGSRAADALTSPGVAVGLLIAVVIVGFLIGVMRLRRFELSGAE